MLYNTACSSLRCLKTLPDFIVPSLQINSFLDLLNSTSNLLRQSSCAKTHFDITSHHSSYQRSRGFQISRYQCLRLLPYPVSIAVQLTPIAKMFEKIRSESLKDPNSTKSRILFIALRVLQIFPIMVILVILGTHAGNVAAGRGLGGDKDQKAQSAKIFWRPSMGFTFVNTLLSLIYVVVCIAVSKLSLFPIDILFFITNMSAFGSIAAYIMNVRLIQSGWNLEQCNPNDLRFPAWSSEHPSYSVSYVDTLRARGLEVLRFRND